MFVINDRHMYEQLAAMTSPENVLMNEKLYRHTYTQLGGEADFYVTPETYEQVQAIVKWALDKAIPCMMLGNGSNLIIKDGGIRGIVLNLGRLANIYRDGMRLVAQSGARIIDASQFALSHALTGLEFACGIPGSVGGALFMNAGAYHGEIKDVLESAVVVDQEGRLLKLDAADLDLAYRSSNIPDKGYIVLEATFLLQTADYPAIKTVMDDLTHRRESKQPLEYPSCGSVFKRPPGYFAGKLIQDSQLQGRQIGGAQVSLKHAGFIINRNGASATEYIDLIHSVQATIKQTFDVTLEREVKIIGEDPVT